MDNNPQQTDAKRKVLCIEDEYFIGELYVHALENSQYTIKLVADGAEGLKEAQTNQYDLILLDLMVPNVTGIEILRTLRDVEKTPELKAKIIVTTNLEQKIDEREEIEKEADAYVVKAELTPNELVKFLDRVN